MHGPTFFHLIAAEQPVQQRLADMALQHGIMCHKHFGIDGFLKSTRRDGIVLVQQEGRGRIVRDVLERLSGLGRWEGIVGLSETADVDGVVDAMKAGALSFHAMPRTALDLRAILQNAATEFSSNQEMRARQARAQVDLTRLSDRERQVLDRLAGGDSNKDIARELNISPRTVEVHRMKMMGKLGARNAAEAIRLCLSAGLPLRSMPQ